MFMLSYQVNFILIIAKTWCWTTIVFELKKNFVIGFEICNKSFGVQIFQKLFLILRKSTLQNCPLPKNQFVTVT